MTEKLVIKNVSIMLSGALEAPILDADSVVLVDGKIAAVGTGIIFEIGDLVERIDAEGKHVSPGLIDCHSHTGVSGGA